MANDQRRERLRFTSLRQEARGGGMSHVVVELQWRDAVHRGQAVSTGTPEGDLRAGGDATAAAVQSAVGEAARVGLLGIKAVRAFDGRVVIAAVEFRETERQLKVLGAQAIAEDQFARAAVLAVLDALNRVLEPILERGVA